MLNNESAKHFLQAAAATVCISLGLFYLMASLISNPGKMKKSDASENMIDFLRTIKPRDAETRNRRIPKKPPEPKVAPKIPKMAVAQQQDNIQTPDMAMDTPLLDSPLALGDGPYLGGASGGGAADGEPIPLVKPLPQYPRKAARSGKEGSVVLKIDITAAGTVENVRLVRSKPRRLFDQAAIKNAYQYRYRPKMVGGKPVAKKDHLVQIDFKIQR